MQKLAKILVLIVAYLFICMNSFAQQGSFGMSIGPTYSKPVVKNASGIANSTTYSTYSDAVVSLMGQYYVRKNFGFVFDAGICHRGLVITQPVTLSVYNPEDGSTSVKEEKNKYRHELSYFDNYLLAKYRVGNKFKVYVNGGVYFSALFRSRKVIVDEYYNDSISTGPTEAHWVHAGNLSASYKGSDAGLAFGLGIEYGRFGLDYRYSRGLVDILNHSTVNCYTSFSTVKLTIVMIRSQEKGPHIIRRKLNIR